MSTKLRTEKIFLVSFLTTFAFLLLLTGTAHAQSGTGNLSVEISPQYPGPNTNVTLRLTSYSADLDRADISWTLDGNQFKSGKGEKMITIKTGAFGETRQVGIIVSSDTGDILEKDVSITPLDINLLWEAKTYTPPFYKGKAAYTNQAEIKVVALPIFFDVDGSKIDPSNLVYRWTVDGFVSKDASGYGKNFINLPAKTIAPQTAVEVEVKNLDETLGMKKGLVLDPTQPKILVYENSSLYGLLEQRAITGNFSLAGAEITLSAVPYFFSISDRHNSALNYTWNINGQNLGLGNSSDVTFKGGDSAGFAQVKVGVRNTRQTLQYVNDAFTISHK